MLKKMLAKILIVVMIITAFSNTGLVIHAEDIASSGQDNILTIYYSHSAWKTESAYIHYKINNSWTVSPGVKMEKLSVDEADNTGCTWKVIINLKSNTSLVACFNNGKGSWDSNSGKNYKLSAGTFKAVYSSSKKYSKISEIAVPTPTATKIVTPVITAT